MIRHHGQQWCWMSWRRSNLAMISIVLVTALLSLGDGAKLRNFIDDDVYRNDLANLINGFLDSKSGPEAQEPDYGPVSEPLATRTRTDVMQLYQSILRGEKKQRNDDPIEELDTNRRKRPSNGLLGIDNLDFTASTLDRARSRSRLPIQSEWQMARQMSKQISTLPASSNPSGMSMSLSIGDMRRMLDMMKAGR